MFSWCLNLLLDPLSIFSGGKLLSRKFGENTYKNFLFAFSVCLGSGAPEASEFIKILDEKSKEPFNSLENFHNEWEVFHFETKYEYEILHASWRSLINLKETKKPSCKLFPVSAKNQRGFTILGNFLNLHNKISI